MSDGSEYDSMWAARAPGDRDAGQPPRHQQEDRPEPAAAQTSSAGGPVDGPGASADRPAGESPTAAFPTSSYQGGAYQGGYPYQSPPSPQSAPPAYPAGSYQAPGYQPGQPYPPPYQYAGATHAQPPASGRLARGGVIVIGAVAIALFSGVAGGVAAHQYDKSQPVTTITRKAAPVVDRSSLAGTATKVQPSVVDITTAAGEGSGVVISADGNILTNNHVLQGAQNNTVNVTFNDGKTAKATIVGVDPAGDLGVIKAQGVSGLTAAKFGNSDDVQVGDTVLALGSPLGLQGSVTAGIVSALHRTINEGADENDPSGSAQKSIGDALQTDAAINPGNSGGALVNLFGEVVGINTAIATSGQGASGNIGVGFAISSNVAKSTAATLLKGGKVSHPYLGVQVSDADGGGALIADVVAGGPAQKAGLQKGDVVTKIGSQDIPDSKTLVSLVKSGKSGDQLQLTVRRNGATQQMTVTLASN